MESDRITPKKKQIYQKPLLRRIELVANEVLGIGCKTAGGISTGVGGQPCQSLSCNQVDTS